LCAGLTGRSCCIPEALGYVTGSDRATPLVEEAEVTDPLTALRRGMIILGSQVRVTV
jgi:hypothetical protein